MSASPPTATLTSPNTSDAQPPAIPSSILSSLVNPGASSSHKAPPLIATLAQLEASSKSVKDSEGKNAAHLYCPREGCGCLLLRKGDGTWTEAEEGMYDASGPFAAPPSSSSSSSTTTPCWLVSNSPFGFENAGFSRNVPDEIKQGKGKTVVGLKYVICADCDLGPLGWSTEGGKEAWMAVERVGYGM